MAVPAFGFSFGDSVNAIQLTARVTHALRASSTAPTECRNAVTFLETVEHTFRRVYDLQHLREDTEAFQQVQVCTQACCEQLVHILERIRRYDAVFATAPEVGAGGLRIRLRKNTAKVKWSLAIKEDLAGIIAAITPQISLLLQLANTDNVASMRQQQERIAETAQHNQLRLARVLRHLELDTCAGAEREDNTVTSAVPVVSLPRKRRAAGQIQPETVDATPPGIDTLTGDAERLLTLLAFCVWRLMSRFMLAMASLPQAPTTFLGSNITLTDGLGRTLRLPYEHFSDWSMILTRLTVAFRGCPGETKVARGNFVIYGTRDKSRRLHDFNWERNVRPGAKVFMVFVIKGQGFPLGHCPRCGCGNNIANHFGWVTWYVFLRVYSS